MRTRLTDRFVKSASADGRKSPIFMDDEVIGFGIQVDWSTVAARDQAKEIKRQVDQGIDPLAARDERRTAPKVKHLVERYFEEHLPRLAPDTASDCCSMMNAFVLPAWGNRKVIDIRRSDVDQLLVEVAKALRELYQEEENFFAALRAKLAGIKQKLSSAIVIAASAIVTGYDFFAPIVGGVDVNSIAAQMPSWAWPLILIAVTAVMKYFRDLADRRHEIELGNGSFALQEK